MWSDTVMAPFATFLLYYSNLYGVLGKSINQPNKVVSAQLGERVTIPCYYPEDEVPTIRWYKQPIGRTPQLLAKITNYELETLFSREFQSIKRISTKTAKGTFNLTISLIELSDSAIYYCAVKRHSDIIFGDGTTLIVTGFQSRSRTVVVQHGDSVTLQCTVHTETCAGEHSVYWFRQGSGESPPGIIYTHGDRSDECQRSSGAVSPTKSCVYNFPKRNLSLSDAGTYYCAVATCGEILFGNGTKLELKDRGNEDLPLYCLAGTLMLSVILNIALMLKLGKSRENSEGVASINQASRVDITLEQCPDVNYAALNFMSKKSEVKRKKRDLEKETVYSDIRLRDSK